MSENQLRKFQKPLRVEYNSDDDISDNPAKANNTYSEITIRNAKNKELCKKTKYCITRVYTQDLYNQHEDRFLFAAATMSHLNMLATINPTHRWTSEIIIPPTELISSGFERLLENTLSQISHAFNVISYGGAKFGIEDSDDNFYNITENNYTDAADYTFLISNMVLKVPVQVVRFCHYGRKEHWDYHNKINDKNPKMKFFDFEGKINTSFINEEDPYSNILDETQPIYSLKLILGAGFHAFQNNNKLKYMDLHVKYFNDVGKLPNNVKFFPSRIIFER
jgi:hypothetical protein